jgi:allantoicase
MDGWETRRRRTSGHDWCVVELGMRGVIRGVNVDTSHFAGNSPSHCSLAALDVAQAPSAALCSTPGEPWATVLPPTAVRENTSNFLRIEDARAWTHVRLNIFPDGGVARLRVYGDVAVDWAHAARSRRAIDVASIANGGLVVGASDMHLGAKDDMIMPGRATNMGDGWETRRRRGPGFDWAIVRLGAAVTVTKVEIDTNHFKGNYPESASVEGTLLRSSSLMDLGSATWTEILARSTLGPHRRHHFTKELLSTGLVSHVRLNIFPDGGVSRFRVYGYVAAA